MDGDLDLIAGHEADPTRLYLNNGTAAPFSGVTGAAIAAGSTEATSLTLGDVDGDNDLDLIEGIDGALNRLYLNTGGSFSAGTAIGTAGEPLVTESVALGDMDGDGDADLIVGNFNQRNRLHLNTGGSFGAGSDIGTQTDSTQSVFPADIDDDGDLDVVVGNIGVNRLYLNNGTPTPFSGVTPSNISADAHNTRGIAAADVNLDGKLDVIAGNSASTINRLYLNNGTADPFNGVSGSDITTDANSTRGIAVADLNGDEYQDVLAANYTSRNRLYLNRGPVHNFPVNGHLAIGKRYTGEMTEVVMTPDDATIIGQAKRDLVHDDVAMLLLTKSGMDQISGTTDDFEFRFHYVGITASANITIEFDASKTGGTPAATGITPIRLTTYTHFNSAKIYFDETLTWFFNPVLRNADVYADFGYVGVEEGSQPLPFNTVAEALDLVAIGGIINFTAGTSSETPTMWQVLTLLAPPTGGPVRIGDAGPPQSSPSRPAARTGFISKPPAQ